MTLVTKLPRQHLVEVFLGELNGNGVVRQIGVGPRQSSGATSSVGYSSTPGAAGNIGQLQPIDRALRKVVASRRNQRLGIERARRADVPGDCHAVGTDKGDLRRLASASAA